MDVDDTSFEVSWHVDLAQKTGADHEMRVDGSPSRWSHPSKTVRPRRRSVGAMTSQSQTVYPSLAYEDAERAIEWLAQAFGFEPSLVVPGEGGGILHAELRTDTRD
jgi:hypothetical protein